MTSRKREKLLSKEQTGVDGLEIPKNPAKLNILFTEADNIHNLTNGYLASGSHVTDKQFIGLRIVSPDHIRTEDFEQYMDKFGLSSVWENAVQLVNSSNEFDTLLHLLDNNMSVAGIYEGSGYYPGAFKPVKRVIEQIKPIENTKKQTQTLESLQTQASYSRVTEGGPMQPTKVSKMKSRQRLESTFTRKSGKKFVEEQQQGYKFGTEESEDPSYIEERGGR